MTIPYPTHAVTLVAAPDLASPVHAVLRRLPDASGPVMILGRKCYAAARRETRASKPRLQSWLAGEIARLPIDTALSACVPGAMPLLICDMDSTILEQECLDELAARVGVGEAVSRLTEKAMRGDTAFGVAFEERLRLLKGVPLTELEHCYRHNIDIRRGARELVATMKTKGARTVLVTGGFDWFAERVARECGFDAYHANRLCHDGTILTGEILPPILDARSKLETLRREATRCGTEPARAVCVGDGANDIPMLAAAGIGVCLQGKPRVRAVADAMIDHTDLAATLFFQGLTESEFVSPGAAPPAEPGP